MMGKVTDFLSQTKVLEEVESSINGKITVIKSLAFGIYIQVEGLTQSGGVVRDVWKTTLKKVKGSYFAKASKDKQRQEVKGCLILGLGGGSAAKLVRKYWPEARITGVEIDERMVELGKKYLGLNEIDVDVFIEDAEKFIKKAVKNEDKYDLILVDMYVGTKIPIKFESEKFINRVRNILARDGAAVFNRLYYDEKKREAENFNRKLIQAFKKVQPVYPEANVMYVCSN